MLCAYSAERYAQVRAVLLMLQEQLQQGAPEPAQHEARALLCTLGLLPQRNKQTEARCKPSVMSTGAASQGGRGAAWRGRG